jgi:hypothetical protein
VAEPKCIGVSSTIAMEIIITVIMPNEVLNVVDNNCEKKGKEKSFKCTLHSMLSFSSSIARLD